MKKIFRKFLLFAIFISSVSLTVSAAIVEEVVNSSKSTATEELLSANALIPADQIFKGGEVWKSVLSGDGKYIAFMRIMEGNYFLSISSVEKKKVVAAYNFGLNKPRIYKWKGKKLIVEINYAIYEIALGNSSPRLLLGHMEKRKELKLSGGIRWKLLSSAQGRPETIIVFGYRGSSRKAYEYNIYTGDLSMIYDVKSAPDGSIWRFDLSGRMRVITRIKDGGLELFDVENAKPRLVKKFKFSNSVPFLSKGKSELSTRVRYIDEGDEERGIYIAHNLESDKFRLFEYNLKAKAFGDVVAASDKYDVGGKYSQTYIYSDSKNRSLGISFLTNQRTVTWIDKQFIEAQTRIDEDYPSVSNRIYQYTDDASVVMFTHDDGARGKDYLYSKETDEYFLYLDRSLNLNNHELPVRTSITYTSKDGMEHDAYLALPPSHKGGPLPMIIMPFSSREGRYHRGFSTWQNFFASRGYAVLRVNHRGVSGYGQEYYISGIENSLSQLSEDIADAATWAIDNNLADKNNLFVFGRQEGGNAALLTSIRYPDLFKAAVVLSAPIDLVNEVKDYKKYNMDNALEYYALAVGDKKWKARLKAMSPAHRMAEIKQPALFIYGKDTTYTSGKKLKKLIEKSGKDKDHFTIIFVKGEEDYLKKNTNKIYAAEKALEYFDEHTLR